MTILTKDLWLILEVFIFLARWSCTRNSCLTFSAPWSLHYKRINHSTIGMVGGSRLRRRPSMGYADDAHWSATISTLLSVLLRYQVQQSRTWHGQQYYICSSWNIIWRHNERGIFDLSQLKREGSTSVFRMLRFSSCGDGCYRNITRYTIWTWCLMLVLQLV